MKSLLSSEYRDTITKAIGFELDAAMTYKQLSNYMEYTGYFGSRDFFRKESEDELRHYQLWADFMNDRGDVAQIPTISAIKDKPESLMDAFTIYYNKEKALGDFYNAWYVECDDAAIMERLIEFVKIQRESIGEAGDLLATLEVCGNDKGALLVFDKELNG